MFNILRRKVGLIYFLTAFWLPHVQFWAIIEVTILTNPILITALQQFGPEGERASCNRLSFYKAPGEVQIDTVENAVIKIELVRLFLWK